MNENTTLEAQSKKELLANDIEALCSLFSLSGFEYKAFDKIKALWADRFDSCECDRVGNILLTKKCGRQNAHRIMLDAHIDEVGMLVTAIEDGGFLRIANVGGIDVSILAASDICVYAKDEVLKGVVCSTPPHLKDSDGALPEFGEILVDIGEGYDTEELKKKIPIGTPVGFAPFYSRFADGYMAGKSFDDKACAAILLRAIADIPAHCLTGDICISLSAREETSHIGAVSTLCRTLAPDCAMVIDVNLGDAPDAPKRETVPLGHGPSVDFSAATDLRLSELVCMLCDEKQIAYSRCAAPSSTGTNATSVSIAGLGIPTVDIGLPLRNMHTYNEVLCLDDAYSLYRLISEFVCSDITAVTEESKI